MIAATVVASVAVVCASGLVALRWVLAHREKKLEHEPIAALQMKMNDLENRLLSSAIARR